MGFNPSISKLFILLFLTGGVHKIFIIKYANFYLRLNSSQLTKTNFYTALRNIHQTFLTLNARYSYDLKSTITYRLLETNPHADDHLASCCDQEKEVKSVQVFLRILHHHQLTLMKMLSFVSLFRYHVPHVKSHN